MASDKREGGWAKLIAKVRIEEDVCVAVVPPLTRQLENQREISLTKRERGRRRRC